MHSFCSGRRLWRRRQVDIGAARPVLFVLARPVLVRELVYGIARVLVDALLEPARLPAVVLFACKYQRKHTSSVLWTVTCARGACLA